jgi:hypothetical protein
VDVLGQVLGSPFGGSRILTMEIPILMVPRASFRRSDPQSISQPFINDRLR